MSDMNVIVLSGRLAADPELRFTAKGTAVASMRVASSRYIHTPGSPEGDFQKKSLFITAEAFGKLAERINGHRKKGDPLMVRGRLILNEWTGEDGKSRSTYRVMADEVNFMKSKNSGSESNASPDSAGAAKSMNTEGTAAGDEDEEPIPF